MDILFAASVVLFAVFGIPMVVKNVINLGEKYFRMFAQPVTVDQSSGDK